MGRTAFTEPQCLYKGDLYLTFTKGIKYIASLRQKGGGVTEGTG